MILRITILNQDGIDEDSGNLHYENFNGYFYIDGQQISAGSDLAGIDLSTLASGAVRSTNITKEDSVIKDSNVIVQGEDRVIKLNVPILNSHDEVNFRMVLESKSSGKTYFSNSFSLFYYDLGNNVDQNIRDNTEFVIRVFDPEVKQPDFDENDFNITDFWSNIANQYQVKLQPAMISYRRPFTDEILYYNATASYGERQYESIDIAGNNALLLGTIDGYYCNKKDAYLKQTITLNFKVPTESESTSGCGCSNTASYTGVSISDFTIHRATGNSNYRDVSYNYRDIRNIILKEPYWIPKVQLHSTNLTYDENCAVLSRKDEYAILNVDEELTELYVNDELTYMLDAFQVTYSLVNHTGKVVETKAFVQTIDNPFVYIIDADKRFDYHIPEVGDYIVYARIDFTNQGVNMAYCEKSLPIDGKHWLGIEQEGCGHFNLINRSFEPLKIVITKLGEKDFTEVIREVNIESLTSLKLLLETDGLYKISATRNEEEIFFILASYCTLRKCLEDQIMGLLCTEESKIKDSTYYQFLSIMVVAQTYFMKLHTVYMLNFAYTFLAPSQLEDLVTMKELLDRATEYCAGCVDKENIKSLNCNC